MEQKEVLIVISLLVVGILVFNNRGGLTKESDPSTVTGNYLNPCYNPCKDKSPETATECVETGYRGCGTCVYYTYPVKSGADGRAERYIERWFRPRTLDCYRSPAGLNQINELF